MATSTESRGVARRLIQELDQNVSKFNLKKDAIQHLASNLTVGSSRISQSRVAKRYFKLIKDISISTYVYFDKRVPRFSAIIVTTSDDEAGFRVCRWLLIRGPDGLPSVIETDFAVVRKHSLERLFERAGIRTREELDSELDCISIIIPAISQSTARKWMDDTGERDLPDNGLEIRIPCKSGILLGVIDRTKTQSFVDLRTFISFDQTTEQQDLERDRLLSVVRKFGEKQIRTIYMTVDDAYTPSDLNDVEEAFYAAIDSPTKKK